MENEYNPKKSTWLNPNIEYIFGDEIIEYDMKDAGFSLIKQHKLLPDNIIRELSLLEKQERHIAVGKIQGKDKAFSDALMAKFAEIREIFININKISENNIISVKKDAIFIIGNIEKTKFGSIQFMQKNVYSSYIRFPSIRNLEIYYSEDGFDIKGMGDSSINKHRLYMIESIRELIKLLENKDRRAKKFILNLVDDYKHQNLSEEYYIEFNNKSQNYDPLHNYQKVIIPLVQIVMKEIG